MKPLNSLIVSRKISAARRRAAGRRIAANIRRLQGIRGGRTARQALAEARGMAKPGVKLRACALECGSVVATS